MAAITVLLLLVSILGLSSARPDGAPDATCVSLLPALTPHGTGSTAASPYTLTVEGLQVNAQGRLFYRPGQTYNVIVRGTGSSPPQFRGVLVQLRSAADQSIIGDQLATTDTLIKPHNCAPSTGGFTHTSRVDKNSIQFQWTPTTGTGDVVFRYTVVQTLTAHWDALTTPVIADGCANSTTVGGTFVYWTATGGTLTVIYRRSNVQNGDYVAVGFSSNKIMPQTDIVVGAIGQNSTNDTVYFVDDRFATVRAMPPRDTVQNLMSTGISLTNGQLEVNFTRRLDTGDLTQDFNLTDRCFYILTAYGRVADFSTYRIMQHTAVGASTERFCFCSGAGMITGLSVWLLLMIAAVQYLL